MSEKTLLLTAVQEIFESSRNEECAKGMVAYMKNQFSFIGLSSEQRRRLQHPILLELKQITSTAKKWEIIEALWQLKEREYHYLALDWLKTFKSTDFNEDDDKRFYALLTTNAWWDSIDVLGPHPIGKWAKQYPERARQVFNEWKKDESFWVNRVCIIYQLFYKEDTDVEFLNQLIAELKSNKEFFIQKAIGWSLRQYARVDAEKVLEIVENEGLTGLAKREALKHFVVR